LYSGKQAKNKMIKRRQKISNTEVQRLREGDFVRLFTYLKKVSTLIGKKKALEILERLAIAKRLEWLKENKDKLRLKKENLIDSIDRIFYKKFYKLDNKDRKVIKKDKFILITRWHNYCPVLEACKAVGLDTREICRWIYHRPNQIFLSKINPGLTFKRNYKSIRPHADYCEEIIRLKK